MSDQILQAPATVISAMIEDGRIQPVGTTEATAKPRPILMSPVGNITINDVQGGQIKGRADVKAGQPIVLGGAVEMSDALKRLGAARAAGLPDSSDAVKGIYKDLLAAATRNQYPIGDPGASVKANVKELNSISQAVPTTGLIDLLREKILGQKQLAQFTPEGFRNAQTLMGDKLWNQFVNDFAKSGVAHPKGQPGEPLPHATAEKLLAGMMNKTEMVHRNGAGMKYGVVAFKDRVIDPSNPWGTAVTPGEHMVLRKTDDGRVELRPMNDAYKAVDKTADPVALGNAIRGHLTGRVAQKGLGVVLAANGIMQTDQLAADLKAGGAQAATGFLASLLSAQALKTQAQLSWQDTKQAMQAWLGKTVTYSPEHAKLATQGPKKVNRSGVLSTNASIAAGVAGNDGQRVAGNLGGWFGGSAGVKTAQLTAHRLMDRMLGKYQVLKQGGSFASSIYLGMKGGELGGTTASAHLGDHVTNAIAGVKSTAHEMGVPGVQTPGTVPKSLAKRLKAAAATMPKTPTPPH